MKKLTSIFFAAVLLVSAGCKKSFFDINQNPNLPTEESMTPELLLPRAIVRSAAKTASSYSNYAGWMGYWARSGTYGANPATEGYTLTASFEQDEWEGWYDILFDFNTAEKKAAEAGQNYYVAVAKIMKSIGFMYLVDQYNNVPYSKAFDVVGNLTPAYDKGPDIYADLIKQLNEAITLLADAEVPASAGSVDIIFHGDPTGWAKLANTQKLKLLIHQSEVISDADATAELASTADIGYLEGTGTFGVNPSDGSAYVQPGYVADNLKQNPFWDNYDTDFAGSQVNDFWRANNFALVQNYGLNAAGTAFTDPRGTAVFDEARSPQGGALYSGANWGEVVPNTGPQAINQSDVSGPGLAYSATQPQWIFTVVESLFLQAEAAQRGWIGGGAQDLYEQAVAASFEFLDLAGEEADYLGQGGKGNWADGGNKIKLIATQRYIALTGINNFEGWVDYRRLDGTEAILSSTAEQNALLSFSPDRNGKQIPLRLIYAQSEYNYNAANVGKEGVIDPQNSRIFWDTAKR